ncbi:MULTISPECIES: ATP-binding protein [unclassified Pseudoalteromonas]|uniref:ATP-binding protein n=1 Tax=unclassified Pseudoalteromonas TaxID=194690 RepID=UPI001108D7E8|nr:MULTISPECIES: ATP-binding protein [unclassified Pseudoalteromonas]TMN80665.1 two-component sensor histidine kinase [Pseudoalteromonas sp. S410]TMN89748.1 two-component sensor histidine kinase [Pseudoalteromonas sp. S408]TMN97359.1 two-component sensor histidine kinase [Pseudoalteromonas sp. S407]TMO02368.1 two-component sensor histidine kinase [Pseudoalteromonas sp. S409]TMO11918.1 two-component sensor histidine kinase [Pseudoalteromonas sp. S186]
MKIHNKLFLILFSFTFSIIAGLVVLIQWSIGQGVIDYVNAKEIKALEPLVIKLATQYESSASWDEVIRDNKSFRRLIETELQSSQFSERPGPRSRSMRPPPPERARFEMKGPPKPNKIAHYALLDKNKQPIRGRYLDELTYINTPIIVNNIAVGYIAVSKRDGLVDGYELDFLEQQTNYLWLIAIAAALFTLLLTFLLSRHLVSPVKQIATGMHQLTQGNFTTKLTLDRKDELGQLSEDFNMLALTLAKDEKVRKRWLANISHELRTPMSILLGELEAMLLGVREPNTQNISSANDEAMHLKRLIDDLHMLNSAELGGMHYTMQPTDLTLLLNTIEQKYQVLFEQHAINIYVLNSAKQTIVQADKTRLLQLFDNILMNALHYAQCTTISITAENISKKGQSFIELTIEDNGVGVESSHLAHLFEYLYRVDDARNRQEGGAGLGLSICKHIVEGHHGEIVAEKASIGGLAVVISLPTM